MIERSELHDAAQKAFPATDLRPDRDASWKLAAEMGWLMMPLTEDAGGLGLTRDCVAAVHYELGHVLCAAPLVPALMTVQALGESDLLADSDSWIERACAGEFITMDLRGSLLAASANSADQPVLSGTLPAVADADMASHLLAFAPGLAVLVPMDASPLTMTEHKLWDETRRLFSVTLAGHAVDPALVLARGDAADAMADRLNAEMLAALAADSLGGASAMLAMTVEYLKTRKQFDRPLAMFQALKHRCADLKTHIVAAEALLWARVSDADASLADLAGLKALATDTYRYVSEEAIQLHGGIGLTEEYPCHWFMKRAMLNLQLAGDLDSLRAVTGRDALARLTA